MIQFRFASICFAIGFGILSYNGASHAASLEDIKKQFFDYDAAVEFWQKNKSRTEMAKEWSRVSSTYRIWRNYYDVNRERAIELIAFDPSASIIRRGHDIYLLNVYWRKGYRFFDPSTSWNQVNNENICTKMKRQNVFTHSCIDYPDWRSPIELEKDNAKLLVQN
ncbi:hypothetical protein [Curvivirga sp.]|uniref:hypothetical protein n=1 Tax=Curvivirga sp. TaxID=2856848 RepID=UPI003B5980AD